MLFGQLNCHRLGLGRWLIESGYTAVPWLIFCPFNIIKGVWGIVTHEISSRPNVILKSFSLCYISAIFVGAMYFTNRVSSLSQFALSLLCGFPLSQTVLKQHRSQVRQKSPTAVSIHEKTGCSVSRTNCLYLYLLCQSLWALLTLPHTHVQWWSAVLKASTVETERNHFATVGILCRKSLGPDIELTSVNQRDLSALHCSSLHSAALHCALWWRCGSSGATHPDWHRCDAASLRHSWTSQSDFWLLHLSVETLISWHCHRHLEPLMMFCFLFCLFCFDFDACF